VLRLSLRSIGEHKVRFALTTFAVVLGVGFVVGAFVVTDTVRTAVSGLFTDINAGVDVTVRARSNLEAGAQGGPASRGRIPDSLLDTVAAVDGVRDAQGSVSGYAQLLDKHGEAVTTTGAPLLGVSWGGVKEATPATMNEGRPPRGPDEVAIDRDTADDYGFRVGDRTSVLLVGSKREVTIAGIFTFGQSNSLLGARLTAFDLDSAQEAFGAPGQYDSIDVVGRDGVAAPELAARIRKVLPEGVDAVTAQKVADEGSKSIEGFLSVFQNVLLGFAGVALLVSAFFINNTFAILLGQRTREFALLRAVGASRRQILGSITAEAVLIGIIASVVGLGFGLLIALALQSLLAAGGFVLPEETLQLTARTVVAALVVGLPITVLSAYLPARRAASVPPVAALVDGPGRDEETARHRLVSGGITLAVGLLAVVLALFVFSDTATVFITLAVGAVAVFIGVAWLSPLVAVPATSLIGRPFAVGISGRLARANAMRTPQRTARAASALMIGLALVTTVFVVGNSIKESFSAKVAGSVRADFVVSNPSFTGFSPTVASAMAELPQLDAVTGVRFDQFLFEGTPGPVSAVDPRAGAKVVDVKVESGSIEALGPGRIAMFKDEARERKLSVGDEVTAEFASGGPQRLTVAAIYGDATYAGNFLIDLATFQQAYPAATLDQFVFARLAPGADPKQARSAIERVLEPFPQLQLKSRSEYEQSQQEQLDQILVSVNGLLALALFIALLGISNTLALSVIERTREIGLLRAVGMKRKQVRRMVIVESTLIAVFGAILGVLVGLVLGLAVTRALPESVLTVVQVPWASILVIVVVAGLFGVVSGMLPARRAARLDILNAISST
jgi:putative ABC transport system permease protein